jgi:hypothetical protein
MADFERSTTVGVGADAAFAYLADPSRLGEYVPTMTHVESIAIDGELGDDPDPEAGTAGHQARFVADSASRRIEWGSGDAYRGSATVSPGTASTSQVVLRLHFGDEVDTPEVDRLLDEAMRNVRRLLSGR